MPPNAVRWTVTCKRSTDGHQVVHNFLFVLLLAAAAAAVHLRFPFHLFYFTIASTFSMLFVQAFLYNVHRRSWIVLFCGNFSTIASHSCASRDGKGFSLIHCVFRSLSLGPSVWLSLSVLDWTRWFFVFRQLPPAIGCHFFFLFAWHRRHLCRWCQGAAMHRKLCCRKKFSIFFLIFFFVKGERRQLNNSFVVHCTRCTW